MNKTTVVVIAVVFIGALALGAFIISPIIQGDAAGDVMVEFYDEDGGLVDIPMAIMAGGAEVVTMRVKVTWTIQATDIKPDSFYVNVVIKVDVWNYELVDYVQQASTTHTSYDMISEFEYTWTLENMLPMDQEYKTEGWKLRIYATLNAFAEDLSGAVVESERATTDCVYAELTWLETTGTLSIVLYEVKRYLQIPA